MTFDAARRHRPHGLHRRRTAVEVHEMTLDASAYILRYDFDA
jgi:hypothetical protein